MYKQYENVIKIFFLACVRKVCNLYIHVGNFTETENQENTVLQKIITRT